MNLLNGAKTYSEMIKLGHTLFALPFALSAVCLAYLKGYPLGWGKLALIVVAFASARSAAMGFNRIVDADVDILNPRTKNRPSVNGKLPRAQMVFFTALSAAILIASAWVINPLCFLLSFPALAVLFGYSYAKRFTCAAHYILGFALALAPVGAWIAVADALNVRILALGAALLFNISAFDLIYAIQDEEFDIAHSLHSVPARFGRKFTLAAAAAGFCAALAFFVLTGILFSLNTVYFICTALIGVFYATGIFMICKCGMARVNLVFFYMSISVSGLLLFGVASNLF